MRLIKTNLVFATLLALAMSCADDEKVILSPSSASNTTEDDLRFFVPVDPDFVAPKNENARVETIDTHWFTGYFARSSENVTGRLQLKVYKVNGDVLIHRSANFSANQLPVWQSNDDFQYINFDFSKTLERGVDYRLEVHCNDCSDPSTGLVYWGGSQSNTYSGGTKLSRGSATEWTTYTSDMSFKITNRSGDGSRYVSIHQATRDTRSSLNNGLVFAQTFRPVLGDDHIISFTDPSLASAVRAAAGIAGDAPIKYGNAKNIASLVTYDISALEGIQYLENLLSLSLHTEDNLDLTLLRGLTRLTSLTLTGNEITNITALASLQGLATLKLSNQNMTNLSPLLSLFRLNDLTLNANNLTSVSSIGALAPTLKKLHLESDVLTDVSAFSSLQKLNTLVIRTPRVVNISSFAGLRELTSLRIFSRKYNPENPDQTISDLSNISPLASLTKLTSLEITDTKISSVGSLGGLTNLTWLTVSGSQITSLAPLGGLTKLKGAAFVGNQIPTISAAIAAWQQLESLNLAKNQLTSLSNLNLLPNLDFLYLNDNNLITQQHVDALQQQLPNTDIYF